MRKGAIALFFAAAVLAADEDKLALQQPLESSAARRIRESGLECWARARPVWETVKEGQPASPEEVGAALSALEAALRDLERSLRMEWDAATNRTLADAVRAWHQLRPLAPAEEPPADEQARRKWEKAQASARRELLRDARRFLNDLGKARRFESIFHRCSRCDGRKVLRSPFGDQQPCTLCLQQGVRMDREAMLEAFWLVHSPLHRADVRNATRFDRLLHRAPAEPADAGPFVRSLVIDGSLEDHDLWVRCKAKEKIQRDPFSRASEATERTYVLLRAGGNWYLYDERHDNEVLELPEEEQQQPPASGG